MTDIKAIYFPNLKLSFHSARHTFKNLLIEQGVNPLYVQIIMGHSSLDTTMNVYGSTNWDQINKEIENKSKTG